MAELEYKKALEEVNEPLNEVFDSSDGSFVIENRLLAEELFSGKMSNLSFVEKYRVLMKQYYPKQFSS